jgi:hypothetical protein
MALPSFFRYQEKPSRCFFWSHKTRIQGKLRRKNEEEEKKEEEEEE